MSQLEILGIEIYVNRPNLATVLEQFQNQSAKNEDSTRGPSQARRVHEIRRPSPRRLGRRTQ
jgi:hypothetical protein